jgi:hypothetical protein
MDPSRKPPTTNAPDLTTVLSDVLGDLAFMIADDEAAEPATGRVWLRGEIAYHGPDSGSLRLWSTRSFASRLAANLLGLEPEDGSAQVGAEDAVREFMNVFCGQLVTAWYGRGPVFNLSIAEVTEQVEPPDIEAVDERSRVQLSVEGEPVFCTHRREE